jgi:hypothetical protein
MVFGVCVFCVGGEMDVCVDGYEMVGNIHVCMCCGDV